MTRVTITDIAERAGVSAGTVDRVIHKRGEVAAKTREKVLQIIREMNYEPDIFGQHPGFKKKPFVLLPFCPKRPTHSGKNRQKDYFLRGMR